MEDIHVHSVRMYLLRPHLFADPDRPHFHDGPEQAEARLPFQCAACGAERGVPLKNEVGRGIIEFDGIKYVWSTQLPHWFGCSGSDHGVLAPDGRKAWFALVQCTSCRRQHVACFSFGEIESGRFVGTLHGAALELPAEETPAPTIALPDADGRWGLLFPNGDLCSYESRVDGLAEAMRDLRVFTLDADGLHWDGGHRSPLQLEREAHSLAPGSPEHVRWLHLTLPLGACVIEHSERYRTRHELALTLRPFDPLPLHFAETIGQGVAADGGEFALTIEALRNDPVQRSEVSAAGCDWVLAVLDAHADDAVALQRLVETALARGAQPQSAPQDVRAGADSDSGNVDGEPDAPRQGWWAAAGEPPLYYLTTVRTPEALAEDIATVVGEMREQRGRDRVQHAASLCFMSNGTQGKLHAAWYDPDTQQVAGDWRYTVMLRHLDGDMDADDIESFAYDASVIWALAESDARQESGVAAPPTVYFLREFGSEPSPLFVEGD